jgi:3-oxoacyl-[acyl-carrier-protein] synthase II
MSAPRRVVVTGVGMVSAAGAGGSAAVARALDRGEPFIRPVSAFDTAGLPCHLAGEVDDAVLEPLIDRDAARRLSRISRLAVAACRLAVDEAKVDSGPTLGLVVGTEFGDFRSSGEFATGYLKRGPSGLSPMLFPGTVMNAMGAAVAITIGVKGPTVTVNQASVAGDLAVARGAALVARGQAEAVLAGGVDELCGPVYRRLADELGMLSPMRGRDGRRAGTEGSRPYAAEHNGPVLGEGATFLVLEDHEVARARGATVLAELVGARWGNVPVAPHTAPVSRADSRSALRASLAAAGVLAAALTACWGAGSGDPALDDWELALLRADLPDRPDLVPPRALAGVFGRHAGVGAIRVAAAALAAGAGPTLAHGLARGGCRTALVLASPVRR